MRRFSYGVNSYYKTASICVEIAPWYIMLLDYAVSFICRFFPSIPLPPIPFRLFSEDSICFNGGKWAKLNKWYGSTNDIFCCFCLSILTSLTSMQNTLAPHFHQLHSHA